VAGWDLQPERCGVSDAKQEPVAWAVVAKSGKPMWLSYNRQDAEGAVVGMAEVIPLYRTPQTCPYVVGRTTLHCSLTPLTLTDEEREAIGYFAAATGPQYLEATNHYAAVAKALLERLS